MKPNTQRALPNYPPSWTSENCARFQYLSVLCFLAKKIRNTCFLITQKEKTEEKLLDFLMMMYAHNCSQGKGRRESQLSLNILPCNRGEFMIFVAWMGTSMFQVTNPIKKDFDTSLILTGNFTWLKTGWVVAAVSCIYNGRASYEGSLI